MGKFCLSNKSNLFNKLKSLLEMRNGIYMQIIKSQKSKKRNLHQFRTDWAFMIT